MIDLNYKGNATYNISECNPYMAIGDDVDNLVDVCAGPTRYQYRKKWIKNYVTVRFKIQDPIKQRFILHVESISYHFSNML